MKYTFDYYLHDNYEPGELEEFLKSRDVPPLIAYDIAESRPFYEVTIECVYDDETGEVEILRATP